MLKNYNFLLGLLLTFNTCFISAAELNEINPEKLKSMQKDNALVIDIRTEKEWNSTGIIPGSHKIEFFNDNGEYDQEEWLKQLKKHLQSPDQPIILVCHSGNRSRKVGTMLSKQPGMGNVNHLKNGIKSWIRNGNKTEPACPSILTCLNQ